MNIDTALEKIYSLKQFHVKLGLDNIKHLLNHLGNPERNLKAIHVAGSNGKEVLVHFWQAFFKNPDLKLDFTLPPIL